VNAAVEPLVFRIVVDDAGVERTATGTSQALGQLGARAAANAGKFNDMRRSTALTRQEILALNYTVSDVAASLASGASPFTILLQQGGQVRDAFGGIGNVFSKVGSLLTVGRVAFGAAAAAVTGLTYAIYEGDKQTREFNKTLQLTGNYAGMTAERFAASAQTIATEAKVSIGLAKDVLQAAVATGKFGPGAIDAVGAAAARLAKITGRAADEVVKDFAAMSGGVAKWAVESNKSYHYLTAEQVRYIRQLEAQGRAEEAMRVTAEALDKALKARQPELGILQKLWQGVGNMASWAWDAMLNVGRADTMDQKLATLRAQLQQQQELLAFEKDGRGTQAQIAGRQAVIDKINVEIDRIRELAKFKDQSAAADARNAKTNAKEIEETSRSVVDQRLALERSFVNRSQAMQEAAREREELADRRALEAMEITSSAYLQRKIARETAALDAKSRLIDAEISLERRRVVEQPGDLVAQQARLVELESKRYAIETERARLKDRIGRGDLFTPGPAPLETAQQQFVQFERARQAETEKAINDRRILQSEAANELLQVNRSMSISLIRDERERGQALLALEEEQIRKRLDLASMSVDDRKKAEADLATWRVLREKQLTEELKPEWQRQLESYDEFTQYKRQVTEQFHQGFIDNGRDAFESWVKNGKVSARSLFDFIQMQLARLLYDRFLAGTVNKVGGALLDLFGLGGGDFGLAGGTGTPLVDLGLGAGRAKGGRVQRGRLHPVNEEGSELLHIRGRTYLMPGADGEVTPAHKWQRGGGGGDIYLTIAPTFNGGVTRNELSAGMAVAAEQAVAAVAEGRRRRNPAFTDG
jgi:phage-related minor tail protein